MRYFLWLPVLALFFHTCPAAAQTAASYKNIDSLIETGSMVDAMMALQELKTQHRKDTGTADYWLRYAQASYAFRQPDDGLKAINKAISFNPKKAEYYFEKGVLTNSEATLDTALAAFTQAITLQKEGKYYYWRGIVQQRLGQNGAAEKDYQQATSLSFETPELYNNLAILQAGDARFAEALSSVNKALALKPQYAQAYSARGKINLYTGQIKAACEDIAKAQTLNHRNTFDIPDSVCNGNAGLQLQFAAELNLSSKFYQQAINCYTRLIAMPSPASDFYLNRGFCYYNLQDYKHAEADYLKALTLPGATVDQLYDNLSLLYFDQAQYPKSIEYATKRITLNPQNPVPYIDRGLAYRKIKQYKEAEKDFNQSLTIQPGFFRALGYRAFLHLELEQYQLAFDDALSSVRQNTEYGYGYVVLAQAKMGLGMKDYCMDLLNGRKFGEEKYADPLIQQYCK